MAQKAKKEADAKQEQLNEAVSKLDNGEVPQEISPDEIEQDLKNVETVKEENQKQLEENKLTGATPLQAQQEKVWVRKSEKIEARQTEVTEYIQGNRIDPGSWIVTTYPANGVEIIDVYSNEKFHQTFEQVSK